MIMSNSPIELVLLPPLFCEPNVTEPWEAAPSANLRSQAAVMMSTSVASPGSRTPRASSNFVTRAQRSPIPNPIPLPNSVILSKAFAFLSCGSSLGGRRFSRGLPILDLSWLRTACPFLAGNEDDGREADGFSNVGFSSWAIGSPNKQNDVYKCGEPTWNILRCPCLERTGHMTFQNL
ncbi:hypothetical protein C4D60_Mb01t01710 [Musa balbisiana]|uniref:Uncharacterized protein n=1 Tax=Musa balbisiana TaxID=52838 RepID=A0A4S8JJD3_MUSBA|nr:hypothetical protein C4D60_Mb01t01710 [Musa balbisiana]